MNHFFSDVLTVVCDSHITVSHYARQHIYMDGPGLEYEDVRLASKVHSKKSWSTSVNGTISVLLTAGAGKNFSVFLEPRFPNYSDYNYFYIDNVYIECATCYVSSSKLL